MRPQVSGCREDDGYASGLLRERRRDLESLRFEYESKGMSLAEYSSCQRALLQAIVELENLLRDRDTPLDGSLVTKSERTAANHNRQ